MSRKSRQGGWEKKRTRKKTRRRKNRRRRSRRMRVSRNKRWKRRRSEREEGRKRKKRWRRRRGDGGGEERGRTGKGGRRGSRWRRRKNKKRRRKRGRRRTTDKNWRRKMDSWKDGGEMFRGDEWKGAIHVNNILRCWIQRIFGGSSPWSAMLLSHSWCASGGLWVKSHCCCQCEVDGNSHTNSIGCDRKKNWLTTSLERLWTLLHHSVSSWAPHREITCRCCFSSAPSPHCLVQRPRPTSLTAVQPSAENPIASSSVCPAAPPRTPDSSSNSDSGNLLKAAPDPPTDSPLPPPYSHVPSPPSLTLLTPLIPPPVNNWLMADEMGQIAARRSIDMSQRLDARHRVPLSPLQLQTTNMTPSSSQSGEMQFLILSLLLQKGGDGGGGGGGTEVASQK